MYWLQTFITAYSTYPVSSYNRVHSTNQTVRGDYCLH